MPLLIFSGWITVYNVSPNACDLSWSLVAFFIHKISTEPKKYVWKGRSQEKG